MDKVYRRQRHIYDLTRKYYLLGRDRLVKDLGAKPGETVIEIGCGTARNLIKIAEAYPGARLFGLDASAEMLRTAQEAIERAKLSDRIVLVHGEPTTLEVLQRQLVVPEAEEDVARFSFDALCKEALGAADYLALARTFRTILIDHIPRDRKSVV